MVVKVLGEIEGRVIDPYGPPSPGVVWRRVGGTGDEVKPGRHCLSNGLDSEATVLVEQGGAIEYGESANVCGQILLAPSITWSRGQAVDRRALLLPLMSDRSG